MKKLCIIIPLLLFSFVNFGQKIEIKYSKEVKGSVLDNYKGFLKGTNEDIYFNKSVFSLTKETNYFIKIDKNLNIGDKTKVGTPSKDTYGFSMIELDGKFFWFTLKLLKKKRIFEREVLEVNPELGVRNYKTLGTLSYHKYKDVPNEIIYFSPDSSKILIADFFDEDKKKENYIINFVVLDRSLNVLMEKKYDFKISQRKVDVQKVIISNEGKVFWLSKIYNTNSRKEINYKTKKPDYIRVINSLSTEGKINTKKLKLTDLTLTGALMLDKKGDLFIVLPYKNKKSVFPEGLYIKIYNSKTLKLLKQNNRIFSQKEINEFGDWKSKEKKFIDFYNFNNNWINDESGLTCYMDKTYMKSERTGGGYKTFYYSKSGVTFRIDSSAKLLKTTLIPKAIVGASNLTSGTLSFKINNRIYYLYNDTKKNLDKPISDYKNFKLKKYFSKETAVLAYVNNKGILKRNILNAGKGYLLGIDHVVRISDNKILIYFVKFTTFGMKYKFATLSITK